MNRSGRNAFTLVELLVVIAILSVLAALLLPSIENSMKMARRVQCANNLRQHSFAINAYLEDYEKYPSRSTVVGTYISWAGKRGTFWTGTKRLLNPYVGFTGVETTTTEAELAIFHDPCDSGGRPSAYTNFGSSVWNLFGSSYMLNVNGNLNDSTLGLWNKRPSDIQHPTIAVMESCQSFRCWESNCNPYSYMYWHHSEELGWGNVAFVDGHVAFIMATRNNPDYQRGDGYDFNVTR